MFSDFACPWCYITKRRLEAAIDSLPANIAARTHWRPFPIPRPSRDHEAEAFLTRLGASEGITFAFDRITGEPDTGEAHRLVVWAQQDPRPPHVIAALVEGIYRAHFSEGSDIGDRATLATIARESGLTGVRFEGRREGRGATIVTRESQRRARALGIDTIPFLLINGHVGIRGSRSTSFLLQKIQGASWFGPSRASGLAGDRRKVTRAPTHERRAVEALIDDILDDTFPASDAPTWGTAANRIRRQEREH
ncbi:MAG TPA: DsbA family oxidoreductase [Gemmatimonadales bacterium]|nr:DsbA family oxidoreductase [Gemmatimonadales bacterium]